MTCSLSNLFSGNMTHTLLCLTEPSPWLPGNGDGYANPPVALVVLGALGLSSFQCMHLERELLLHTSHAAAGTREIPPFAEGSAAPCIFHYHLKLKHRTRTFMNVNLIAWDGSIQPMPECHTTPLVLIPSLSGPCTTKQIYCHTCSTKSLKLIQVSKHNFPAVKFLLHILPSSSIIVLRCTLYIYQRITVW